MSQTKFLSSIIFGASLFVCTSSFPASTQDARDIFRGIATQIIIDEIRRQPTEPSARNTQSQQPNTVVAEPATTPEQRRQVQGALNASGFDVGPEDGIFGRGTRSGLKKWQAANSYEPTGYLTAQQLEKLVRTHASGQSRTTPENTVAGQDETTEELQETSDKGPIVPVEGERVVDYSDQETVAFAERLEFERALFEAYYDVGVVDGELDVFTYRAARKFLYEAGYDDFYAYSFENLKPFTGERLAALKEAARDGVARGVDAARPNWRVVWGELFDALRKIGCLAEEIEGEERARIYEICYNLSMEREPNLPVDRREIVVSAWRGHTAEPEHFRDARAFVLSGTELPTFKERMDEYHQTMGGPNNKIFWNVSSNSPSCENIKVVVNFSSLNVSNSIESLPKIIRNRLETIAFELEQGKRDAARCREKPSSFLVSAFVGKKLLHEEEVEGLREAPWDGKRVLRRLSSRTVRDVDVNAEAILVALATHLGGGSNLADAEIELFKSLPPDLGSFYTSIYLADFATAEKLMVATARRALNNSAAGLLTETFGSSEDVLQRYRESRGRGIFAQYILIKSNLLGTCGAPAVSITVTQERYKVWVNDFGEEVSSRTPIAPNIYEFVVPKVWEAIIMSAPPMLAEASDWAPRIQNFIRKANGCNSDVLEELEANMFRFMSVQN